MTKWADYLISHVRRDQDGDITHVLLHTDNGSELSNGVIKTASEVIQLLKFGNTVKTTVWAYPKWMQGADVTYIKGPYKEFLRTIRDKTEKDNLDNLIPLY